MLRWSCGKQPQTSPRFPGTWCQRCAVYSVVGRATRPRGRAIVLPTPYVGRKRFLFGAFRQRIGEKVENLISTRGLHKEKCGQNPSKSNSVTLLPGSPSWDHVARGGQARRISTVGIVGSGLPRRGCPWPPLRPSGGTVSRFGPVRDSAKDVDIIHAILH